MPTLSSIIFSLLVNAVIVTFAQELKPRAPLTGLPDALETADYASIFITTCSTSMTPKYTSYTRGSTITSFAVVGCGNDKGSCKSGYVTTSSACCPRYLHLLQLST